MPDDNQLEQTPADVLHRQIQEFINAASDTDDGPALLDVAVVVYETISYDDEGEPHRKVDYTATSRSAGLASTAGLMDIGREVLSADLFDGDDDD